MGGIWFVRAHFVACRFTRVQQLFPGFFLGTPLPLPPVTRLPRDGSSPAPGVVFADGRMQMRPGGVHTRLGAYDACVEGSIRVRPGGPAPCRRARARALCCAKPAPDAARPPESNRARRARPARRASCAERSGIAKRKPGRCPAGRGSLHAQDHQTPPQLRLPRAIPAAALPTRGPSARGGGRRRLVCGGRGLGTLGALAHPIE